MTARQWIADGPVSMPTPTSHEIRVPMGGFCFTPDGMAFDASAVDLEEALMEEAKDG